MPLKKINGLRYMTLQTVNYPDSGTANGEFGLCISGKEAKHPASLSARRSKVASTFEGEIPLAGGAKMDRDPMK